MEQDFRIQARKQYLNYFKIWFIVIAVLMVITLCVAVPKLLKRGENVVRNNAQAPAERVYDYAEQLTEEEEQQLRILIAQKESEIHADIVLVTTKQYMGEDDYAWEAAMRNYADDFYDEHNFGYEKVHGSGILLLDNYYEEQGGTWLSTCGEVYERFGDYEIERVLDAVEIGRKESAYEAYRRYVERTCDYMQRGETKEIPFIGVFFIPTLTALIYALVHLHQSKAKDTTTARTYVSGGKPVMVERRDDFIRKSVVKRRIETNSGSSGGGGHSSGHSSGRGGSHTSSSGVSHGGGGRRR